MKKTIVVCAFLVTSCAAMQKRQQAIQAARNACYQQDPGTVYQETFAVLAGQYSIARESERRGFVETDWKEDADEYGTSRKTRVTAEITGDSCVRVALRLEGEALNAQTGEWGPYTNARSAEDELYLTIHQRIMQHPAGGAAPAGAPPPPGPEPTPPAAQEGTEGGPCYGNGTCNEGLSCASNLCVRLPSE
jgi:hypothetical protein